MNTEFRNEMCSCGHLGGHTIPELQNHEPNFQDGHGKCIVKDCSCNWFTWTGRADDNGKLEIPLPSSSTKIRTKSKRLNRQNLIEASGVTALDIAREWSDY